MILCCGEALIDFVPLAGARAYAPHAGGSVFNIAVGLGRLDAAVETMMQRESGRRVEWQ